MSEQFEMDQHDFFMSDKKKLGERLVLDGVIHIITPAGHRLDVNLMKKKVHGFEVPVWDFNYCTKQPHQFTGDHSETDPVFRREHVGIVLTEDIADVVKRMFSWMNDYVKPAKPGTKKKIRHFKEPEFDIVYRFFHKLRSKK